MQSSGRINPGSSKTDGYAPSDRQQSKDRGLADLFQKLFAEAQASGLKMDISEESFAHNAKVLFNQGQFSRADGCFGSAHNFSEDSSQKVYYLFMRGLCNCKFRNRESDQEAIIFFDQIISSPIESKWVDMARGFKILLQTRNVNSQMLQHVSNPTLPVGKTIAAEYWGSQLTAGQRDEAIKSFQAVVDKDPDCAMGWEYLAILKMNLETLPDMEQTTIALQNLVRIIPEHEKGWEFLSVCLFKLDIGKNRGLKEYAEEIFDASRKALELNPQNERAFCNYQTVRKLKTSGGSRYSLTSKDQLWEEKMGGWSKIILKNRAA